MATIRSGLKNLKQTLTPMSWKSRVDHLWTYYKWVPITLLVLILVAASVIPGIVESKKELLFGGLCVNCPLPEDVHARFTEDLFVFSGGTDPSRQKVTLRNTTISPDAQDPYAAYAEGTIIAAQISARELDYILMDTDAKDYFSKADTSTSLEELLTTQQLAQLQEKLIYRKAANGNTYPFAIDLSGTAFAAACGMAEKGLFIAFPGNTERAEYTDEFVDFLLSWK